MMPRSSPLPPRPAALLCRGALVLALAALAGCITTL